MFWSVTLSLLEGLREVVKLFALTLVFSLPLGLAVTFGSMSKCRPVSWFFNVLVWIVRGTPLMLQLTPMETDVLRRNLALLESFGFELEEFGEKYALRATPYLLQNPTEVGFFTDILDRLTEERISNVYDTKILAVATMACKAAVKGHDVLSTREAEELIHRLLGLEHPFTCPHGRPTIIELTKYEMEKMFKRIQN